MIIKFIITIFAKIGIFLFLYIVIMGIIEKVFFDKDKEGLIEETKEQKIDLFLKSKFVEEKIKNKIRLYYNL